MASGFQETFDKDSNRPIEWHHVEGDASQLKQLLSAHHFSLASFEPLRTTAPRAEFDDAMRWYMVRLLHLAWQPGREQAQVVPLYVWADKQTVVSWSPEPLEVVHSVREKLGENRDWVVSSARLVYYLFDDLLGLLFPFLDALNDRMAQLEQNVLRSRRDNAMQERIFRLKREVLNVRRILASMRDTVSQLVRYWSTAAEGDSFYYMELYDHMIRLFDTADTYRELINSVLDLHMSTVNNRLNEIVKTLTLVTTVLLPASVMAALYGMNFDRLPLSHHEWGFFIILGIIVVISSVLYWIFRRRQWL